MKQIIISIPAAIIVNVDFVEVEVVSPQMAAGKGDPPQGEPRALRIQKRVAIDRAHSTSHLFALVGRR